jgi:uncharacterized protein YbjT (DUF2867 family)
MERGKDLILVSGATGKQGGAVARELLAAGHKVRAMTRHPDGEPARALRALGAEVVRADYDDPATLSPALAGAWGAFAVQNTWEAGVEGEEAQGKRFAEAARQAGVHHFVYSSVGSAHRKTGIPHFDNKWRIEEKVRSLGFPSHTVLRPTFFMENWISPWFKPGLDQGKLAIGIAPTTPLQMIAVADIGRYGKLAFERHEDLEDQALDLAGDSLPMPKVAEVLAAAMGRKVAYVRVPIEEVRKASADFAAMLEWFDRVGYEADIKGLQKKYKIPATSLAEWAKTAPWK